MRGRLREFIRAAVTVLEAGRPDQRVGRAGPPEASLLGVQTAGSSPVLTGSSLCLCLCLDRLFS